MAESTTIRCPECQGAMRLRPGRYGQFYACLRFPECSGAHGAHPDGSPKGFPGNAATRRARIDAHQAFDGLWKTGRMSRKAAYRWMQQAMGMTKKQAHIAKFTERECRQLIDRIRQRATTNPTTSPTTDTKDGGVSP